ncbi:MAG TPA: aminotransferase class V-fold PLP-dependent enzyme, partial [Actinomycetota bacterium]|nr:aminotransferase class V-fold PLP-dependent enzyme [Actinomycetota bacterium]
ATIPEVVVHGDPGQRLPHLVAFSVLYIEGEALLLLLDGEGIAVHSGSSCTADSPEPSHVLAAMGAITHGSVRVSFLRDTTESDVDRLLAVLPAAVADLREMTELDTQAIERAAEGSGEPQRGAQVGREGSGEPQGGAPVGREGR